MRCKKHPADLSSSVGVCASCLRERLFAVMAAQAQAQAQQDCRKSHTQQTTPLSFPRSVSPYISRRKSDTTRQLHGGSGSQQRFYSTPLVGPTGSAHLEMRRNNNKGSRFSSLFLGLFRSKLDKPDSDSGQVSDPRGTADSCSASPSWFSTIIPGRRKKQNRTFWLDERPIGARRKAGRNRDRGMSPARYSDDEDDDKHFHGGSSGYSSESSQGWRQTPRRTPATTRRGGGRGAGHSRNVSGMTFCLSPLVRPSPNRHWNQKGVPPEMLVAGESRVPPEAHLSTAASFCKSRSRKLANFGRYTYNTNH